MMQDPNLLFYFVIDDTPEIIGEFTLENFTGLAAQIHCCLHPERGASQNLRTACFAVNEVLQEWKNGNGSPYVETLYGVTPITNRVSTLFNQKVGFRRIGILPKGITDHTGTVVDAVLTVKERINDN